MERNEIVGSMAGLWRFPVKSMIGERLGQTQITSGEFVGDRAYTMIDLDTGADGLIANSRGHFDSAEYRRQLEPDGQPL